MRRLLVGIRHSHTWDSSWRFQAVVFLGVISALVITGSGKAQEDKKPVKLLVSYQPTPDPKSKRTEAPLRPNRTQPVYLFAQNTSKDNAIRELTITLRKVGVNGQSAVVAKTVLVGPDKKTPALDFAGQPGSIKQIIFGDPKELAKGKGKPAKVEIPLEGPPFEFEVWMEKKGQKPWKFLLPVGIQRPYEYVKSATPLYDNEIVSAKFSYKRLAEEKQRKIPTSVLLAIPPYLNPPVRIVKSQGTFRRTLPLTDNTATLRAKVIPPKSGRFIRVYFNVDGYKRAFGYTNSAQEERLQELPGTRLRILAPRFAIPGKKTKVKLEVDNLKPPPSRSGVDTVRIKQFLHIEVDTAGEEGKTEFFSLAKLNGPKEEKVWFNPKSPDGALLLKTSVRDWEIELDTKDLFGVRTLRARLEEQKYTLNKKTGQWEPAEKQPIYLVGEQKVKAAKLEQFAKENPESPFAPLSYQRNAEKKVTAVQATVTLDGVMPLVLLFPSNLQSNSKFTRGKKLRLDAYVASGFSPVTEVVFFEGQVDEKTKGPQKKLAVTAELTELENGQIQQLKKYIAKLPPEEQIPEEEFSVRKKYYFATAILDIPTNKEADFVLNAIAASSAGKSKPKTIILRLVDDKNGKGKTDPEKVLATVTGLVTVGGQPQAGVTVTLTDPKGKKVVGVAVTKTKKELGKYYLKKVIPGVYRITATNPVLKLSGSRLISVLPGMKKLEKMDIQMTR